jgi:hypothetical protein
MNSAPEPPPLSSLANITDLPGLSAPVNTLVQGILNATAALFGPWLRKRDARAAGEATAAIFDVFGKQGLVPTSAEYELADRAKVRVYLREIREQKSIESVITEAISEVRSFNEDSIDRLDQELDPDWLIRLFDRAKHVTNEQMLLMARKFFDASDLPRLVSAGLFLEGEYGQIKLPATHDQTRQFAWVGNLKLAGHDLIISRDGGSYSEAPWPEESPYITIGPAYRMSSAGAELSVLIPVQPNEEYLKLVIDYMRSSGDHVRLAR